MTIRQRPVLLSERDLALLDLLSREGTLVAACRILGIGRDAGIYRLERLSQGIGRPVVHAGRGGHGAGGTRLTPAGVRLLRSGVPGSTLRPSKRSGAGPTGRVLTGTWHRDPAPHLDVGRTLRLFVTFDAREGERTRVVIDPESVLLAEHRFASSARNVLDAIVRRVGRAGPGTGGHQRRVELDAGGTRLTAALTRESVRALRLSPGRPVVAYLKASAVRRWPGEGAPTRGSRPS